MARTLPLVVAAAVALAAVGAAIASPDSTDAREGREAPTAQSAKPGKKQPVVNGFYKGRTVPYFDFGPVKLRPGNKIAPIWVFTNGADGQRNVIDTVPGDRGYSPLWQVNRVTWAAGETPRVLKSAAAVRQAAAAGEVRIAKTATVVNCPVLGFGQKRHPGFSAGRVIHYYDLGPVKVRPGNEVVILYTVTNGVAGQRNITPDTLAPGQTAYPPLWAIVEVTWTDGATPRKLTSNAAVERAQAAGQVTLKRTNLVVNCPIVV
jgi:hypothetical protein